MSADNGPPARSCARGSVTTGARADISVHHPVIGVVLELDQVVRRVADDERPAHLHHAVEPGAELAEQLDLAQDAEAMHRLEVRRGAEGDPEVAGVEVEGG